ncbi:MAG: glycosyltransferase [Cytophagales bacterium]|nr:glycosyltransferase [Cytophagales bacterium]
MKDPLVSIIMAVKDTAPYLPDCLDSILDQTYPYWELIAVNDHSTDQTPEILSRYSKKDSRISVFDSKRHSLIPTLQEGYKHVRGALINRMDSDDKMPPYKLQVMVDAWKKHKKGSVIAGGTKHFVDDGEVGNGFRRYEEWLNEVAENGKHKEEIYRECVIPSHSWMMHKDDFDLVGAFDSETYPEDYDLCFRIYAQGLNIVGLNKILHYWRDRSNRISRTWECYRDNRYFGLKLKNFYKLDRDLSRPLILWGAGKNGKDMAKLLIDHEDHFHWVCNNHKKIGKHIYGILLESCAAIQNIDHPQIMIVVSTPAEKKAIKTQLETWNKKPVADYWFFL